jgi:hypothetical protein
VRIYRDNKLFLEFIGREKDIYICRQRGEKYSFPLHIRGEGGGKMGPFI